MDQERVEFDSLIKEKEIIKVRDIIGGILNKWHYRYTKSEINGFILLAIYNLYVRFYNGVKQEDLIKYIKSSLYLEATNIILKDDGYLFQPEENKRVKPTVEESKHIRLIYNIPDKEKKVETNIDDLFKKAKLTELERLFLILKFDLDMLPDRTPGEWSIDDLSIEFNVTKGIAQKRIQSAIEKISDVFK